MTDAWLNAFGAGLDLGVDVPTAVVGNGLGNSAGAVTAGDPHAGDGGHFGGFGDINIAVDVPTVVAGNGVGNTIGNGVFALGGQDIADHGFHAATPFGEINVSVATPTVVAANGVGNSIGGGVDSGGSQNVGDHGVHFG